MPQLSDVKREAILSAATRMFLEHGYSAVTMDAIAVAAPVSKPTLYNHFDGKPALFEAVIAHQCGQMMNAFDRVETETPDLVPGLTLITRACVDVAYSSDSLRLFRLMIAEQGAFPELGKRAYRTGVAPFIARVAHYLATAVSPPGIRFEDVDGSARLLLDLVLGDEHLRCLLGVKSGISAREKTRLVGRIVPIYLRAHREPP